MKALQTVRILIEYNKVDDLLHDGKTICRYNNNVTSLNIGNKSKEKKNKESIGEKTRAATLLVTLDDFIVAVAVVKYLPLCLFTLLSIKNEIIKLQEIAQQTHFCFRCAFYEK